MCEFCKEGGDAASRCSKLGYDICRPKEETARYLANRRRLETDNAAEGTKVGKETEWKTVERKKARLVKSNNLQFVKPRDDGKQISDWKSLENNPRISTYFFTNFPEDWGEYALSKMFKKYGSVVDLFVAKKRNKRGQRFGFVRFKKEEDDDRLQKKLQSITIGVKRLVINKSKFQRERNGRQAETIEEVPRRGRSSVDHKMDGRSFKDVILGNKEDGKAKSETIIQLPVSNDQISRLKRCWIGEARSIDILRNIWSIMAEVGIQNHCVKYIGGLSITCEWESIDAARMNLELKKESVGKWVKNLRLWDEKEASHGRLVWIEVDGIPIHAKCDQAVSKIAEKYGEVLEVDKIDPGANLILNPGALIWTKSFRHIQEVRKVRVLDQEFEINVLEEANRAMLIYPPENEENDDGLLNDDGEDLIPESEESSFGEDDVMDDSFVKDSFENHGSPSEFNSPVTAGDDRIFEDEGLLDDHRDQEHSERREVNRGKGNVETEESNGVGGFNSEMEGKNVLFLGPKDVDRMGHGINSFLGLKNAEGVMDRSTSKSSPNMEKEILIGGNKEITIDIGLIGGRPSESAAADIQNMLGFEIGKKSRHGEESGEAKIK